MYRFLYKITHCIHFVCTLILIRFSSPFYNIKTCNFNGFSLVRNGKSLYMSHKKILDLTFLCVFYRNNFKRYFQLLLNELILDLYYSNDTKIIIFVLKLNENNIGVTIQNWPSNIANGRGVALTSKIKNVYWVYHYFLFVLFHFSIDFIAMVYCNIIIKKRKKAMKY